MALPGESISMRRPANATWTHFGEFFESVARLGIDEFEAADALLTALKNGVVAVSYRRQFTTGSEELAERLPRDLHPMPVPPAIWSNCGDPKHNLVSHWQDDPEDPLEWIEVDWVSGYIETLEWEWGNFEHLRVKYYALQLPQKDAKAILGKLSGNPKKRPGRPDGPSNEFERRQVRRALEMIAAGDGRAAIAIANDLTDNSLTGDALEAQKRRLAWGIKKASERSAKNSPEN